MTALLDVNVLINWAGRITFTMRRAAYGSTQFSLEWVGHHADHRGRGMSNFKRRSDAGVDHAGYRDRSVGSDRRIAPGHVWPDDVPLIDQERRRSRAVSNHRRVTDCHLIALAARYRGQLVTFDTALAIRHPQASSRGVVVTGDGRLARPVGSAGAGAPVGHRQADAFWHARAQLLGSGSAAAARKPARHQHRRRTR